MAYSDRNLSLVRGWVGGVAVGVLTSPVFWSTWTGREEVHKAIINSDSETRTSKSLGSSLEANSSFNCSFNPLKNTLISFHCESNASTQTWLEWSATLRVRSRDYLGGRRLFPHHQDDRKSPLPFQQYKREAKSKFTSAQSSDPSHDVL